MCNHDVLHLRHGVGLKAPKLEEGEHKGAKRKDTKRKDTKHKRE